MSERITTTCQHSHTVTLRLDEGEWRGHTDSWIRAVRIISGRRAELLVPGWDDWWVPIGAWPAEPEPRGLRAELEAALAAAEASCGGCGCADSLDAAPDDPPPTTCHCGEPFAYGYDGDPTHHRGMCARCDAVRCDAYPGACEDAAPDARGSDLSAEQPATVSEQGHAKKRAEWNDPKEGQ